MIIGKRPLWEIVDDGVHKPYLRCPICAALMLNVVVWAIILLLFVRCAPLWLAAGIEIEHDEWCKTHQHDYHCR